MNSRRHIFISGGGRRLGKCLAEHYLENGWRVTIQFNTANELEDHPELTALKADLTQLDDLTDLAKQLSEQPAFDAVIHNASCFVPDRAAQDLPQHYQDHFRVHVLAPAMITDAISWNADAAMVVISDIYADIPNGRFAAYCAAKAGLHNWATSMAQTLAGKVRVNTIQPGPIQFLPEHNEAYREMVLSQSLINRELGYSAIVEATEYLINAQALSGTRLRVDGGRFVSNRYDQTFS